MQIYALFKHLHSTPSDGVCTAVWTTRLVVTILHRRSNANVWSFHILNVHKMILVPDFSTCWCTVEHPSRNYFTNRDFGSSKLRERRYMTSDVTNDYEYIHRNLSAKLSLFMFQLMKSTRLFVSHATWNSLHRMRQSTQNETHIAHLLG
jgi:hypothetical protein